MVVVGMVVVGVVGVVVVGMVVGAVVCGSSPPGLMFICTLLSAMISFISLHDTGHYLRHCLSKKKTSRSESKVGSDRRGSGVWYLSHFTMFSF